MSLYSQSKVIEYESKVVMLLLTSLTDKMDEGIQ